MYKPTEIIFSATTDCNLHCGHCFVRRHTARLDSKDAVRFLESCTAESGGTIERVGFSGGEPFLYPEFITEVSQKAVQCGMMFGRLMTNGDFWHTEAELQSVLRQIADAGFDGKIGLSWDSFHGQTTERILTFIQTVFEVWQRPDCIEILSVVPAQSAGTALNGKAEIREFKKQLKTLAAATGSRITGRTGKKTGCGTLLVSNRKSGVYLPVFRFQQSFLPSENRPWTDSKWFDDDFCESTGQVLYVQADGAVSPCCGFANEEPALQIGTIHDTYRTLLDAAARNSMVIRCYETGLASYRKEAEKNGRLFPGKTQDMCMFCSLVCRTEAQDDNKVSQESGSTAALD